MLEENITAGTNSETSTLLDDPKQNEAVDLCGNLRQRIVSVTGQAGTGKTTIIKRVVRQFRDNGISVALCAPTGKAAKRIKEATGIDAMTIHRLLEYTHPGERDPETGQPIEASYPRRDKFHTLDQHVVIVDEYAMVPHELHQNLVNALRPGGALRLFGDIHQLPPIEKIKSLENKPTPFQDMLAKFPSVVLEKVYRQDEGSTILEAASLIRKGQSPIKRDPSNRYKYLMTKTTLAKLEEAVLWYEHNFGADFSSNKSQVIIPKKKPKAGSYDASVMLQQLYEKRVNRGISLPRSKYQESFPVTIYEGDKVIWTANTYDLRDVDQQFEDFENRRGYTPPSETDMILNGEMGVIEGLEEDGSFFINLGDRRVYIPKEIRAFSRDGFIYKTDVRVNLDLGYAITTHKAQGSEWENVIYCMTSSSRWMHNRRQFYTAVTRASKTLCVITDPQSMQNAVRREK